MTIYSSAFHALASVPHLAPTARPSNQNLFIKIGTRQDLREFDRYAYLANIFEMYPELPIHFQFDNREVLIHGSCEDAAERVKNHWFGIASQLPEVPYMSRSYHREWDNNGTFRFGYKVDDGTFKDISEFARTAILARAMINLLDATQKHFAWYAEIMPNRAETVRQRLL